jgi:hypothetical protein
LQPLRPLFLIATLLSTEPGFAQKLVDPNTVAPEFREAAVKRRAEQMRMMECSRKAEQAKVLPRERAAHINHCLESAEK